MFLVMLKEKIKIAEKFGPWNMKKINKFFFSTQSTSKISPLRNIVEQNKFFCFTLRVNIACFNEKNHLTFKNGERIIIF